MFFVHDFILKIYATPFMHKLFRGKIKCFKIVLKNISADGEVTSCLAVIIEPMQGLIICSNNITTVAAAIAATTQ